MSKYKNQPQEFNGEKYRSKREMNRHLDLMTLQRAGKIVNLEREDSYQLAPAVTIQGRKRPALRYFADFTYYDLENQCEVVEDCKGVRTTAYNIKRHLMKSVHGIDILET